MTLRLSAHVANRGWVARGLSSTNDSAEATRSSSCCSASRNVSLICVADSREAERDASARCCEIELAAKAESPTPSKAIASARGPQYLARCIQPSERSIDASRGAVLILGPLAKRLERRRGAANGRDNGP